MIWRARVGYWRSAGRTAFAAQHRSHLPLKVWFMAAWLVATHKDGISALQLWLQLGLGSYKPAWLLLQKLRRAMVGPDRVPLAGLVEVDETSLPLRTTGAPIAARSGRSDEAKLLLAGAVEIVGKRPGWARLAVIEDYSAATLGRLRRGPGCRRQHGGQRRLVGLRAAQGGACGPAIAEKRDVDSCRAGVVVIAR